MVGVAGHRAVLPCDLAPPAAASSSAPGNESVEAMYSVYLVLWYREDQGEPLYRYIHYGMGLSAIDVTGMAFGNQSQ